MAMQTLEVVATTPQTWGHYITNVID